MSDKTVMVRVDAELIQLVKKRFSESEAMTATGLIDWALRYLLKEG